MALIKNIFLVLILAFTPIQEQDSISLDDLMNIGSYESYQKFVIENGWSFLQNQMLSDYAKGMGIEFTRENMEEILGIPLENFEDKIQESYYYLGVDEDKEAIILFHFYTGTNYWDLEIKDYDIYNSLVNQIIKRCSFVGVNGIFEDEMFSSYNCPGAKFPDYIGFTQNGRSSYGKDKKVFKIKTIRDFSKS
jgi:hypothetical protein